MTDLLVRGGTVVTAAGSRGPTSRSAAGRSRRSRPICPALGEGGGRGRRRERAARPAGRRRRPHAYARRDGRRAGPLLPGLGRGGVRRDDDVPRLQQPGHRLVAGRGAVAARRAPRVAGGHGAAIRRSTTRSSLAISGRMDDPVAELPAMVDEGVATAKAFMVFDFRLDERRLFEAMRVLGARGGMLQVHCEDPVLIDTAVADALARATRRRSSTPRPARPRRRRWRPTGSWPSRAPPTCRSTSCTCLRGGARHVREAKAARRARARRDVPALPRPHRRALCLAGSRLRGASASSRRRSARRRTRTRCGRASRTARSTSSPPTTSPTGWPSRRPRRCAASRSTRSATARRASRRCWRSPTPRASRRAG